LSWGNRQLRRKRAGGWAQVSRVAQPWFRVFRPRCRYIRACLARPSFQGHNARRRVIAPCPGRSDALNLPCPLGRGRCGYPPAADEKLLLLTSSSIGDLCETPILGMATLEAAIRNNKNVNINKSMTFPWIAGSSQVKPGHDDFGICKGLRKRENYVAVTPSAFGKGWGEGISKLYSSGMI
jgi:hypothetical protein